jgi:hypothetical protein
VQLRQANFGTIVLAKRTPQLASQESCAYTDFAADSECSPRFVKREPGVDERGGEGMSAKTTRSSAFFLPHITGYFLKPLFSGREGGVAHERCR